MKVGVSPYHISFNCDNKGHWKGNCSKYLMDKKDRSITSTLGIYVIEINFAIFNSQILDIGCGSHICANVQGLKKSRDLLRDEVDLRVGNGAKVVVLAVGSYCLSLPSRLLLNLNNCYYVPSMNRNLISILMLDLKVLLF